MTDALTDGRPIKGWCPGALRPMPSGDGLIVRPRISGGIVPLELAAELARWSLLWGNGQIELTGRGNVQLRGIAEPHLPALHDAMSGWGLLDETASAEAVRNVIRGPLAGLDPSAVLDIGPIADALERRLAGDAALHELPGKFGFAIDDGGALGISDVPADIRFTARASAGGPEFTIRLAGAPDVLRIQCRPGMVADAAVALSLAFLRSRRGRELRIRRMRDLVAERGAEAIARKAGLAAFGAPFSRVPPPHSDNSCIVADPPVDTDPRVAIHPPIVILGLDPGISRPSPQASPEAPAVFVGVGFPFGAISAHDLASLASAATQAGARELRLSPWRAILVPVPSRTAGQALLAALGDLPFILDPADPRRRIAACPGAPACPGGTTDTRRDATSLVRIWTDIPGVLHVSGCEKGCAHPRDAAITLVARAGQYDVVLKGPPSGQPSARGLTPDQIAAHVARVTIGNLASGPSRATASGSPA